ncbi:U6 snRNA-associated Sm-like protein LSm4p [Leishmania guyanensis]
MSLVDCFWQVQVFRKMWVSLCSCPLLCYPHTQRIEERNNKEGKEVKEAYVPLVSWSVFHFLHATLPLPLPYTALMREKCAADYFSPLTLVSMTGRSVYSFEGAHRYTLNTVFQHAHTHTHTHIRTSRIRGAYVDYWMDHTKSPLEVGSTVTMTAGGAFSLSSAFHLRDDRCLHLLFSVLTEAAQNVSVAALPLPTVTPPFRDQHTIAPIQLSCIYSVFPPLLVLSADLFYFCFNSHARIPLPVLVHANIFTGGKDCRTMRFFFSCTPASSHTKLRTE